MLEKASLNFPVYALRDIETAVREGFTGGEGNIGQHRETWGNIGQHKGNIG